MRLSHQIERYILAERYTTVSALSRYFAISESRCREELQGLVPYGVELREDGAVLACIEEPWSEDVEVGEPFSSTASLDAVGCMA